MSRHTWTRRCRACWQSPDDVNKPGGVRCPACKAPLLVDAAPELPPKDERKNEDGRLTKPVRAWIRAVARRYREPRAGRLGHVFIAEMFGVHENTVCNIANAPRSRWESEP